jgi:hypothetical protein
MEDLENTFSDLASFSLNNPLSEVSNEYVKFDYYYLIYIGIAVLIIIIGILAYKFYSNSKKVRFSEEPKENTYEYNEQANELPNENHNSEYQ